MTIEACTTPDGYVNIADDCDDTDETVHPDSLEYCNGKMTIATMELMNYQVKTPNHQR